MPRSTRQQEAVRKAIETSSRPLSPGEVHDAARQEVASISLSTVYRALGRMVDAGDIVPVDIPGGPPRYETTRAAARHHHHFHCRSCDRVYDLDGCARGVGLLAPEGFEVDDHEILLFGRCRRCRRDG